MCRVATTVTKRFRFTRVLAVAALVASVVLTPHVWAQDSEIAPARLRPVDTSVAAWRAGDEQARRRSALMASASLDFSEDPPRGQYIRSFEKMAMLKEILEHIELPSYDQILGKEQVEAENISHWTIPGTLIDIVKIETGPDAGEFLISKKSVANLPRYYELVKDLPNRPAADIGLYEELRVSPGPLIPKRWIDELPGWTRTFVFGYPIWQSTTLLAALALAAVLVRWLFRWGRAWDDRVTASAGRFRFGLPLALLGTILATWLLRRVIMDAIWLFGIAYHIVSIATYTVMFACGVIFVIVVTDRLGAGFMQRGEGHKRILEPALARILFRLLGIIVVFFIVIYAAEFFGLSIAPLVAGLGVGGLAIALAIRPTLENILGGLTMFADRPVRVGDFCGYGSEVGTVHEIGLRSTRIRSLERTLVTIPNAEFSQMKLENFSARDTRLLRTTLQLRYETTMDQLRYVLAELRKLLLAHPMVTEAPARVRFVDFGDYSLNVEIFAYLRCQDQNTNLAIREDILFRVTGIVREAGTDFAFPTQTIRVGRDEGLNEESSKRAETTVDTWRKSGTLPFPEFDNELRREIEDRLDYPPEGSTQNKPGG
jgi:MscS family membrane protein